MSISMLIYCNIHHSFIKFHPIWIENGDEFLLWFVQNVEVLKIREGAERIQI